MNNDVKQKAKMLLAGLAVMPAMASAAPGGIQGSGYGSPYGDEDLTNGQIGDGQLSIVSGLTESQLQESRRLVTDLNNLDVVTVTEMKITKAPVIPYNYNMPNPADVAAARVQNLDRLAKLRAMIEAAK